MATTHPQVIRLDPDGSSVAAARRFVDDCLTRWGLSSQSDEIQLVADELVTNAIQHSRGPVTLAIARRLDRVVVQVQDPSPETPEPESADLLADNGRGLLLVDQIATDWGSTPTDDGKRVWAEVSLPD